MKPTVTAWVAALLIFAQVKPAVSAPAQAAGSFTPVPLEPPQGTGSHLLAYASLAIGAGLIGSSFTIAKHADRSYDDYLTESNPDRIEELYDRTVRYDRLSTAALLGGNVLLAGGLYLRFLRHQAPRRFSLDLGPRRCAATLRF